MWQDAVEMLQDTLRITEEESYAIEGESRKLKLSQQEMEEAIVFLPSDLEKIENKAAGAHSFVLGRTGVECVNMDTFSCVRQVYEKYDFLFQDARQKPVLVLNLANAFCPGGGVRRGCRAQEEDLCRRSTLLRSLESKTAAAYYQWNRQNATSMGSDGIIISPQVEIFKDEQGNLLEESQIAAVMTCAAPNLRNGIEGMDAQQYQDMLRHRIDGMLKVAAHLGYRVLVLGAFGCGAFRNDAHVVSDLFYQAMKGFSYNKMQLKDCFDCIEFAVLSRSAVMYNYKEFARNFNHFYRDEEKSEKARAAQTLRETEKDLDRVRGCLFGGAVGDALGYPIEFQGEAAIFGKHGPQGLTHYLCDAKSGKALISDDTQMTLFTAAGLLMGETRMCLRGIGAAPCTYVEMAYQDWLKTQKSGFVSTEEDRRVSWLMDVPELFSPRAPGMTCMSALSQGERAVGEDYISHPLNNSKGCGGIMRIAPIALKYRSAAGEKNFDWQDMQAAQVAAITHGHPLGYMPAAVLSHIISEIFASQGRESLEALIEKAKHQAEKLFQGNRYLPELVEIMELACQCAHNTQSDLDNIHVIGEGWVAEETLGIAIYCALKYQDDFSRAVSVAVSHRGDSDSTGAVTGNILGAWLGYDAIDDKWKQDLELSDVILEMADDLCHGCQMNESSSYEDPAWTSKYVEMHRYSQGKADEVQPPVFFWKIDEENGAFSNWYPARFVIDDFEYSCVEQYMMAQKAKLFHDAKHYTQILREDDPHQCKQLGRLVENFDAAQWDEVKYTVVKTGNAAKFSQNPALKQQLLQTGDRILAEASPQDGVWGIRMDAARAAITPQDQWSGQNLLGKALMEVRQELRQKKD